jgi:putative endonuclease
MNRSILSKSLPIVISSGAKRSREICLRMSFFYKRVTITNVKTFYVYIMASESGTLYIGVTSNIKKRFWEHKNHLVPGFTEKYRIEKLLYFETIGDAISAINREKQMKKWRREKKVKLIDSINPRWTDISQDWYD